MRKDHNQTKYPSPGKHSKTNIDHSVQWFEPYFPTFPLSYFPPCDHDAGVVAIRGVASGIYLAMAGMVAGSAPLVRETAPQHFWRVPMSAASRSIAIDLGPGHHLAFDVKLLRTHTAWEGPRLPQVGMPFNGQSGATIRLVPGTVLWETPPWCPWSVGSIPHGVSNAPPAGSDFRAVSTKGGRVTLQYDIAASVDQRVRIHESARTETNGAAIAMVRRFELAPCAQTLWMLAHAERGRLGRLPHPRSAVILERGQDAGALLVVARGGATAWKLEEGPVSYTVESITEASSATGVQLFNLTGHLARAFLEIPPHSMDIAVEVATVLCSNGAAAVERAEAWAAIPVPPPAMGFLTNGQPDRAAPAPIRRDTSGVRLRREDGDEFFALEHLPVPRELDALVGGMDWFTNGNLAFVTWPGEIYIAENILGPVTNITFRRFAGGLDEPLGLKIIRDQIYVAQKCELTRVLDTDGNGTADGYESINDDWGYSGNLHSFAYGPVLDAEGNFVIALDGNGTFWETPYRGWAVKISPDGKTLGEICSGLRTPNGLVAYGAGRDLFSTDNEGHYIGTCKLNHLRPGNFFGYYSSWPRARERYKADRTCDPPAVWLPRKLSFSASGLAVIPDDRFGPFKDQLLIGDFGSGILMRVALDRVEGEWQGAVWPFARGFASGPNRLAFGPDGRLYIGGLKRSWPSVCPEEFSLERIRFTGKIPFEVKAVRARPDGLSLEFTSPVDRVAAENPALYGVAAFTYKYHAAYGSPEIDFDGKENSATSIPVVAAEVAADGLGVGLKLSGWRAGSVLRVQAPAVRSAAGRPLWHDTFYYTLNRIPAPVP